MDDYNILLVEDNEGDIFMTTEAIQEHLPSCTIEVIRNGLDAIQHFENLAGQVNPPKPDLVFLDINLPRRNGHDVLQYIKSQQALRTIPVVMLTTSSSPHDINQAYQQHVNSYLTKPIDMDEYHRMMSVVLEYWLTVAKLV